MTSRSEPRLDRPRSRAKKAVPTGLGRPPQPQGAATTLDTKALSIRTFRHAEDGAGNGMPLPPELVALRKEIYGNETGFLDDSDLVGENDFQGTHTCLYLDEGDGPRIIAAVHACDAESADFAALSGLSPDALRRGVFLTRALVAPRFRHLGLFPLLTYICLREFRVRGRDLLYAYMEPDETPAREMVRYSRLPQCPPREVRGRGGAKYEVVAVWQQLAYGMHRAYQSLTPGLKEYVRGRGLFAEEAEWTVLDRLGRFYAGPWLSKLISGEMTKEQYVVTLSNMYQFVKWTTRILAKVVGMTADPALRKHYLAHLRGEIDHERMIEHDLRNLGADLEYVMEHMVPLPPVQQFMSIQESLSGFHQDPVLFLAVPFSIEGLSARLPEGFGQALFKCIQSWGVADPRKVTSFMASHVHTDGGEDGHWEKSRHVIQKVLVDETQLRRFLNVIHLVMDAQEKAYSAYVDLPDFSVPGVRRGGASAA